MAKGSIFRNLSSVIFRYLPGCYVSFDNLITKVDELGTVPINVNTHRIFSRILSLKENFVKNGLGSDLPDLPDDFVFYKPQSVNLKLHPLTMYCSICKKGYSFDEAEDIARVTGNRFKCIACQKGYLKQLPFVYVNEYGFVDQIELKPCSVRDHGKKYMRLVKGSTNIGKWRWKCSAKGCNRDRDMNGYDPSTGKVMWPTPATAGTIFYPHTTSFVNLPDEEMLHKYANYREIITAHYLGLLAENNMTLKQALEIKGEVDESAVATIEKLKQMGLKIPEELKQQVVTGSGEIRKQVIEHVKNLFQGGEYDNKIEEISYSILEYLSCKENLGIAGISRDKRHRSMSELIETEGDVPTKEKYTSFKNTLAKFGFTEAWIVEDLNIITAVYGYSRKEYDPSKCRLCKFPEVKDDMGNLKTPIYGTRDVTEGILFKIDRKRILEWLKERFKDTKLIENIPETERELKEWFLTNIDIEQAHSLNEIDDEEVLTKAVYNLIHSISHSLLITGSDLCGIDKESMGEIIFPNIPAILIYSNNPSEMGAMTALFEGAIIPWLDKAAEHVSRCIYDPVCINDVKGACLHCAYISEISCSKLNKDLDRKSLIGYYDCGKTIYRGFWHDQLRTV
ncbi:hypothetical protein ACFL0V_02140 [Nanoarchaeota archaeon]